MKTNTLCCTVTLLMSLSFSLYAMEEGIEVQRNAALATTAHFTGPIRMENPRIDAQRESTTIIQQHSTPDFTGGDPRATLKQQVINAAKRSIPSLVYDAPSDIKKIVLSIALGVLPNLVLEWVNRRTTSELSQINEIELFVGCLTKDTATLSVNSEEYKQKKEQIDVLLKEKKALEDSLYQKLTNGQSDMTVGSIVGNFLCENLHLDAIMNNLRHIGNSLLNSASKHIN